MRLAATFGDFGDARSTGRESIWMAGEGVTAMIVAADAGDNPLAGGPGEAAAVRQRKAKVAKLKSQTGILGALGVQSAASHPGPGS